MTAPTKQLIMDRDFFNTFEPSLTPKVTSTMEKLLKDHSTNGLHVEPIRNCADARVRTARVDRSYRMVLFDLGSFFLLSGVYMHDKAYAVAEQVYARVNPTSGAAEIRNVEPVAGAAGTRYTDSELKKLVEERAAEMAALRHQEAAPPSATGEVEEDGSSERNSLIGYEASRLSAQLGVDVDTAIYAVGLATNTELVDFLSHVGGWQADALMDLATGNTLDEVRATYVLPEGDAAVAGTEVGVPSDSDAVIRAATSRQAGAQFHLIRDDAALEQALASGDFDAWRLFLHPDQKEYVEKRTNGPFRLSGGAGTGKTVVLVHRAVRLARDNPDTRILVVSFTRNLVDMIRTQIRARDSSVRINAHPGRPGIAVQTMDQVANWVLQQGAERAAGQPSQEENSFAASMKAVLGWGMLRKPAFRKAGAYGASPWDEAMNAASSELPENLRVAPFFQSEYQEVILPGEITTVQDYARASRVGRGSRLGRKQRKAVWDVVTQYRDEGLAAQAVDWDEAAAVAAHLLRGPGAQPAADHVLIDEGQDFTPTRWKLARALVANGPDDLFIAEDSNQRIYGNRIVLGHYGIEIRGRARRLRLNYRTTEENLQLALKMLEGGSYNVDEIEDAEGTAMRTGDRYISSRSGPVPTLLPADHLAHEYDMAAKLVEEWVSELSFENLDSNTLGILTRTRKQRDAVVHALNERGVSTAPVDTQDIPRGMPAVMTLHRAKGTEFSRVLLFGVSEDAIPRFFAGSQYDEQAAQDSALRERSLLYVGATRARDRLAISWSKEASPYLPRP